MTNAKKTLTEATILEWEGKLEDACIVYDGDLLKGCHESVRILSVVAYLVNRLGMDRLTVDYRPAFMTREAVRIYSTEYELSVLFQKTDSGNWSFGVMHGDYIPTPTVRPGGYKAIR